VNRQQLTLLSIAGVFVILLVVRAFTGNGFGRIYVERGEAAFVKVEVPVLDAPDGNVESEGVRSMWVDASSDEAVDFAAAESPRAGWYSVKPVSPRVYFEATISDDALQAALSSPFESTIGSTDLGTALETWRLALLEKANAEAAVQAEPSVEINWKALHAAGFDRKTSITVTPGSDFKTSLGAIFDAAQAAGDSDADTTVVVADGRAIVTTTADDVVPAIGLSWPRTIGLWLAAIFTLAIFSFLYKDNPFYKIAESVVVGVSAAYWMVIGLWDMIVPNLLGQLFPGFVQGNLLPGLGTADPNWAYLVPAIFGALLLMRLAPKGQYLSLWTLAFIVGTTAALRMVAYIEGDFLSQIKATIEPLYQEVMNADGTVNGYSSFWASVRQITLLIGVLSCLTYFFFSVEHKGVVGKVARVGIWFLMITFGAAFGFTVMGRIALLAARFEFLFDDWLWLIDPTNQRSVAAAVGCLF
jgi:hypothetical protein